jgi:hypothetical protein
LNSPDGLVKLCLVASGRQPNGNTSDLIREVVLRCLSFNGIPKTINTLAELGSQQTTALSKDDLIKEGPAPPDGWELWSSVYGSHSEALVEKLGSYHPDLPRVILHHHYGPFLSGSRRLPFCGPGDDLSPLVGRILTSVIACACLRAQKGAHRQLTSHIHGLFNAYSNDEPEIAQVDPKRVFSNEKGIKVLLLWVDRIMIKYKTDIEKRKHEKRKAEKLPNGIGPDSCLAEILGSKSFP